MEEAMNTDPLLVVNPKTPCPFCKGVKKDRKECHWCHRTGYIPVNLNGLWAPSAAFLVCGGPSINKLPYHKLADRGVASLGINNVAGHIPVSAWCFGDPADKFHHGIHLDPKCLTFAPLGKLGHPINVKMPDGRFRKFSDPLRDCPGTLGFSRDSYFKPETFFTTTFAHWGVGEKNTKEDQAKVPPEETKYTCLCTMLLGIRLLHYLGCPRVYLLGVDFEMTDQAQYSFNQSKNPRNGRYEFENDMLNALGPTLAAEGMSLMNCNPESKCNAFPFVPFDKAFLDCKGGVPHGDFDLAGWYDKGETEKQVKANPTPVTVKEVNEAQAPRA